MFPLGALMPRKSKVVGLSIRLAKTLWGEITHISLRSLEELIEAHGLSVTSGDLLYLHGGWYVTHVGLLRLARRSRCCGIRVHPVRQFCDPTAGRWVFRATVYRSRRCKGFVGFGDADPSNVSSLVRGAEMRVAETRAVNRALRKAYGIGLCSVEELGWLSAPTDAGHEKGREPVSVGRNIPNNGQPRLRDRLCLLIRQHQLDPVLVKCYAADFCGTETLRGASRELVESFITHLAEWAARDRDGLLCKLNSYAKSQDVKS